MDSGIDNMVKTISQLSTVEFQVLVDRAREVRKHFTYEGLIN